jgi:hypothetical protein
MRNLSDGYAFELPAGADWEAAPDDDWDTVMVVPSETVGATRVGTRPLDGYRFDVYRAADGRHFAQRPC